MSMIEKVPDGLRVLDDPIGVIRRRAEWFGGEAPRAKRFASNLLRELIFLKMTDLRVERNDIWWIIYSQDDWLLRDGEVCFDPFFRLVAIPELGPNWVRSEVLITALADAAVTAGADGERWLAGSRDLWPLPRDSRLAKNELERGRALAFTIDRGE